MVGPAGPAVNISCNQTTPSPKWIIIFSRSVLKGARIWCRGGYSASVQGKEDFKATPPLSDVVLFAFCSQVIFDLAITATSLQRIPREGQDVFDFLVSQWK